MACVKANGYGHGITTVAEALSQHVDGYAVACLEEALALREAGVDKPVLLLEGPHTADEVAEALAYSLTLCISNWHQLEWLESRSERGRINCWLKIDTGMHRLGFSPGDGMTAYRRLQGCVADSTKLVLCTHFARADERADSSTEKQLRIFDDIVAPLAGPQSCANSAAILSLPASHRQWVRPGYMLYGGSPFADATPAELGLKPGMQLSGEIISLRTVPVGDRVGYGGRWVARRQSTIATIAAGYGDGYPRHAPDGTPLMIEGQRSPLAGRVSMDMLTVDVTDNPAVRIGSTAILWGDAPGVDEIASNSGTIGYELLAGMPQRVRREVQ